MAERFDPVAQSSDYQAMKPFWSMVTTILGGIEAMRKAGTRHLPKFESESDDEYKRRLSVAPWTPLYDEAVRNVVSKPFEKELSLIDPPPIYEDLAENIDGRGNHLYVFARDVFRNAIDYGVDWIFVDWPRALPGATLADERQSGARPVWHRISAERMLAVYEAAVPGGTILTHVRIDESVTEFVDREEVNVKRVRVIERPEQVDAEGRSLGIYGPPEWELWESTKDAAGWAVIDSGVMTIDEIPAVPMLTGERVDGSWLLRPPMRDLAYMQITEWQMGSNRRNIQDMTAFPMLVVAGVDPDSVPDKGWPIGPRRAMTLPPGRDGVATPTAGFMEPSGSAGTMLRDDLELHRAEMRNAGMQPLLPKSGNVTATAQALAQAKAHSAVQTWALGLKDALEQAFVFTAKWLDDAPDNAPNVSVFTDFDAGVNSADNMRVVIDMYDKGLISREASIKEAQRRNILGPEYDEQEDLKLIDETEDEGEDLPAAFLPATPPGEPAEPQSGMDEEA